MLLLLPPRETFWRDLKPRKSSAVRPACRWDKAMTRVRTQEAEPGGEWDAVACWSTQRIREVVSDH